MPRTPKKYSRPVNIKITPDQYEEWENFAKKKGIEHMATFIRWGIDALVNGELIEVKKQSAITPLEKRIHKIEQSDRQMETLTEEIRNLIQIIADKTPTPINPQLYEYQKGIVLNLLQENPRTEKEIMTILPELDEKELLSILNGFLKLNIISIEKNGTYKVNE